MSKPRPRPNTKLTGERSEAAFLYESSQRRFAISKPWGDSERYDFILDNRPIPVTRPERSQKPAPSLSKGVHLFRIQIKCTDSLRAGAYETRATYELAGRHIPYTKRDIDFVAAHIIPLNLWYIIPVEICTPAPMLRFYPHRIARNPNNHPRLHRPRLSGSRPRRIRSRPGSGVARPNNGALGRLTCSCGDSRPRQSTGQAGCSCRWCCPCGTDTPVRYL